MKESFRHGFLSLIAVTAINMFIIPAVFMLRVLIFGNSGGVFDAFLYFAISSAGFVAGRIVFREDSEYFEATAKLSAFKVFFYLFNVKEKGRLLANIGGYASILIPMAAAAILYGSKGAFRLAFEVLFLMLPYLIALKNSGKTYSDILYNQVGFFGFFIMAAAIITSNFVEGANYLKWYFYAILYVYILFYLIIRNQDDIDTNIYSKKYIQKSILPKNMRGFNLLAVLGLYSIILVLFNFKTVAMFLIKTGMKIIGWVIYAVLWLMSLLFPKAGGPPQEKVQAPADFGFFGGAEEVVNPFLNLLGNTAKAFILLYILYKLMPLLLKAAVRLIRKLAQLLKRGFGQRVAAGSTDEYDDEIEIIKPMKEAKNRRNLKKGIHEAKKELAQITDPVLRIRHMYAILLKMLDAYGVELYKSDTTSEICNKTKAVSNLSESFHPITSLYNEVRYAGDIPEKNSLSTFEDRYNEASEVINGQVRSH